MAQFLGAETGNKTGQWELHEGIKSVSHKI